MRQYANISKPRKLDTADYLVFTVQYFESKKWTSWGNAILTGFFYSDVFLPRAYRRNCFVRPSINVLSKYMSFDMIWTETFHSGH